MFALLVGACAPERETLHDGRYDRGELAASLADRETPPGLLLGTFLLANKGVVDGDTIKVDGLDASLRLIGLDCEETFKSDKALRAYEIGFDEYLRNEQAKTERPVKIPTPLGMEAKHFAQEFFADVTEVRLERDHPKDLRDRYNRYLAYVFAKKQGRWVNYNVECVRAGMSPYFSKYGYSVRFHDDFVAAQAEARAAGRGIWNPALEHYRDYDLRLAWWDGRAEFVSTFQRAAASKDTMIPLTHWDALARLEEHVGDEVELLATVGDIVVGRGGAPTRVMLSRRMFSDFTLVFFDDEVFAASDIAKAKGEFVRVRGTVSKYRFKGKRSGDREQLQMVIKRPEQIRFEDAWAAAQQRFPAAPGPAPGDPTVPEPEPEPDTVTPAPEDDAVTPTQPDAPVTPSAARPSTRRWPATNHP
ncbi:MAG: thermonuclease family protein [Nannocystaceae bacterium]|nr:thermonuclease family protein [Nannocystaceae bacterium]